MDVNELRHVGILGMKWGHRMARDGSVTTIKRGKRVPLMKSYRGKPVQVNGRALSNKTRVAAKPSLAKIKSFLESYKSSDKHAVDFVNSIKEKKYKKALGDFSIGTGKLAMEAATGFALGYGMAALVERIVRP